MPLATALDLAPITGLSKATPQTYASAESSQLLLDTVDYDYTGSSDLANNGIRVTDSGLYLASFYTRVPLLGETSGNLAINPTCKGAGDARPTIEQWVQIDDVPHCLFTWYFHLILPVPDVFAMYITNSFDVSCTLESIAFSLKRLH